MQSTLGFNWITYFYGGLLHETFLIEGPKFKGNNFAPNNDVYFQLQLLLSFLIFKIE